MVERAGRRWLGLGAICSILIVLCVSPARTASSGDDAYAALAHRYFYEGFALDPVDATAAGVHDYDDSLGSYAAGDYAKALTRDHSYLGQLAKIDPATLSAETAIDRHMLENALQDDLLLKGRIAVWRHYPDLYVNIASNGVFGIIARDYAPPDVRMRHAILRELAIPALFSQARANLKSVDAASAQIAYGDALGAAGFFSDSVPKAFGGVPDPGLQAQLAKADAVAHKAALDFAAWLHAGPLAHPSGTFAIGADAYSQRLRYEEGLDIPLDRYLRIGEDALAATRTEYVALAHEIDPNASPEDVARSLQRKHPSAEKLLEAAQDDLVGLRRFIIDRKIITVPPDANIKVVETPPFERETTFASMDAPGPLERVATGAFYNVTPPEASWPAQRRDELLGFLNDYARPIVSAHEVYPGHYLNYTIDKHLPLSLTRKLLQSTSFAEGWAHYDEQMIVDEGWGNGDPHVRLAQMGAALTRECRYVVGVSEHTKGMTVDQATAFFVHNAFMAQEPAHREALRGTQDATYGYYTLGKLEILKLRADWKKKMGAAYTLEGFHDELLSHGDPPIPLLRPLMLGSDDDGKVL